MRIVLRSPLRSCQAVEQLACARQLLRYGDKRFPRDKAEPAGEFKLCVELCDGAECDAKVVPISAAWPTGMAFSHV